MQFNYKIKCINLARRPDRKATMLAQFDELELQADFFEAVDGRAIQVTHPDLVYFRHDNTDVHRKGTLGCALSHLHLWRQLLEEKDTDAYVVFEDDVKIDTNFTSHLHSILANNLDASLHTPSLIYLGITFDTDDYHKYKHPYMFDSSYTLHPLNRRVYGGGFFAYYLTRQTAQQLLAYVEENGIHQGIDFVPIKATNCSLYETHPSLVFSDAVYHAGYDVDSDIHYNFDKINLFPTTLPNQYKFADYVFYPNLDYYGGDIRQAYVDIPKLKAITDAHPEAIGFNTFGWIKHCDHKPLHLIVANLQAVGNQYHTTDGIFLKKTHNLLDYKTQLLNQKSPKSPYKIYLSFALEKATPIVKFFTEMVLSRFTPYTLIRRAHHCDVFINLDSPNYINLNPHSLNILISETPYANPGLPPQTTLRETYDIAFSCEYHANAHHTIHYSPIYFSNMVDLIKYIEPLESNSDFLVTDTPQCSSSKIPLTIHSIAFNTKTSFCAVPTGSLDHYKNLFETVDTYNSLCLSNEIASYKFIVIDETNLEEDILVPLLTRCCIIYSGDEGIFKLVNRERIICRKDFQDDDGLAEYMKFLDENQEEYNRIVVKPVFNDPNFDVGCIQMELSEEFGKLTNQKPDDNH